MNEQTKFNELQQKAIAISNEVKKVIIGKNDIIDRLLISFLARGHVLLDDIPGVGKTTMALAFSRAMNLNHQRLQFTPDVLPTDVTGFSVYNKDTDTLHTNPALQFAISSLRMKLTVPQVRLSLLFWRLWRKAK